MENYKEIVKNFQPEFGNQKHLDIISAMKDVDREEKRLFQWSSKQRDTKIIQAEVDRLKERVVSMIEKSVMDNFL